MFLKPQQLNRYYHNITSNTLLVLEAMASRGVKTLIYSSTCATYGEPEKMPITEATPQVVTSRTETLHSEILYVCVFHHLVFLLLKRIILGCTEMLHSFIWYLWVLRICLCKQSVILFVVAWAIRAKEQGNPQPIRPGSILACFYSLIPRHYIAG
jgi:hypothetical protein